MIDSKLFKNSSFSVLQTVSTAIAALILFKLMVIYAGLKITGVWAFMTSINAITGFGSNGFTSALLFYIPKYTLTADDRKIHNLINTTFISTFVLTAVLCIISYTAFSIIIPHTVDGAFIKIAFRLLPFVVISFFFSGISSCFLSSLDGHLLMYIRAKINISGAVVFLISGVLLLLKLGIIGIAMAQVIQNIFLLLVSAWYVKKKVPGYTFSLVFNKGIFKDIFHYGFNFQIISLMQIISEPFIKSMITKYAGSGNTAIFDFCVKLLSVFRSLIIAANQILVPQITLFKTRGHSNRIRVYYRANFKVLLFLSMLFFLSPIVVSDSISLFFLNEKSPELNFILANVSVAFLANALAFPAYFHNLGTGHLKWNVINNTVAALLILVLTPLLGHWVGGPFIIAGWTFAAITGAIILIGSFNKEHQISLISFFNLNTIEILVAFVCSYFLCKYINSIESISKSLYLTTLTNILVLILLLYYPVRKNQTFKAIKERVILRKKSLQIK